MSDKIFVIHLNYLVVSFHVLAACRAKAEMENKSVCSQIIRAGGREAEC